MNKENKLRIQKYISMSGYCSRRKAEELIKKGKVLINGSVASIGQEISLNDVVEIDSKKLSIEDKEYYILNKPLGVICTTDEQFGRDKVVDIIKSKVKLLPVGRLDMYTTGLIILTNDGEMIQKIIHPSSDIEKEYYVTIKNDIENKDVSKIEEISEIDGCKIIKPKAKIINKNLDKGFTKLSIVIHEGRNREIRKICEKLGFKILALHRKRIGKLVLPNIKVGEYIKITKEDLNKIFI